MSDMFAQKIPMDPEPLAKAFSQRDKRIAQLNSLLDQCRVALWKINTFPVHSEPVGSAYEMQDIANDAIATLNSLLKDDKEKV